VDATEATTDERYLHVFALRLRRHCAPAVRHEAGEDVVGAASGVYMARVEPERMPLLYGALWIPRLQYPKNTVLYSAALL